MSLRTRFARSAVYK